ncbi:MAG: nuclear transport factor 2 family protein [Candidatus Cloacimonetes bacterium]|nr:nuclear transport factor 2 family protein [Candidatus Cloacimonadota bacterium]MDD4035366.1 nuclear transport factor 2 family protein [Candidatus Cloacimonadota bacterium]HPF08987.1 nuclear transport factor 2 family protein [Candidatus Cloacimonadota bacterium]HRX76110.1 nuclear transport factor 2 family protein [Candidatus Cloacimonadota bacterium]
MKTAALLCILLVLFACTAKAPEFTETQKNEVQQTIEANMQKLMAAADSLDTSALEGFLSPGSDRNFFMAGVAYNKDELISSTKTEYENFMAQHLRITDHRIKIIDANNVIWTATINAVSTDLTGYEEAMNFTDTWFWEKNGDTWQVSHFHESWE